MPDYDSPMSDEQLLALFRTTAFLQHGVHDAPASDTTASHDEGFPQATDANRP